MEGRGAKDMDVFVENENVSVYEVSLMVGFVLEGEQEASMASRRKARQGQRSPLEGRRVLRWAAPFSTFYKRPTPNGCPLNSTLAIRKCKG